MQKNFRNGFFFSVLAEDAISEQSRSVLWNCSDLYPFAGECEERDNIER